MNRLVHWTNCWQGVGLSWSSRPRWWTNLPAGNSWWGHHGAQRAVVRVVWQQGWGGPWPWTGGAGGGGGGWWGGSREEGEGGAWPWAQTPPVAVQVGGTGWTVVVKTIGQLDVCVWEVGGRMITETHKTEQTHHGINYWNDKQQKIKTKQATSPRRNCSKEHKTRQCTTREMVINAELNGSWRNGCTWQGAWRFLKHFCHKLKLMQCTAKLDV